MNRSEELQELQQELEQTPLELQYLAAKAITKAKKQKRRSFLWKTPVVSFCSAVLVFILLVNLFPAVALAMSNIPILKNLVYAVSLDPSLKLAVENDYYQVVGESQTQEDVTVTVEYMIVDASHISLFFKVDAPVKAGTYFYDFTDSGKTSSHAAVFCDTMYEVGKLEELKLDYVDGNPVPDEIIFTAIVNKDEGFKEWKEAMITSTEDSVTPNVTPVVTPNNSNESTGQNYRFRFVLHPDVKFTHMVKSYPINQSMEIEGQKITFEKLEVYPSQIKLYLDCDKNNNAVIQYLNIYFKGDDGKIYDTPKNGLSASGTIDSDDIGALYFESSYFKNTNSLTMYITGITSIEKDKQYGEINYSQRTITNLPKDVSIKSMELKDSTLYFTLVAHTNVPGSTFNLISSNYYDTDENQYNLGSWTCGQDTSTDEYTFNSNYHIDHYEDGKYLVKWSYQEEQVLEKPIKLVIK